MSFTKSISSIVSARITSMEPIRVCDFIVKELFSTISIFYFYMLVFGKKCKMLFIFRDKRQELPCRGHPYLFVASIVRLGPVRHVLVAEGTYAYRNLACYLTR